LRGWYKSKHEPPGVRPRPCYTEALLTQPYGGACPVRCAFCYVNNGIRGYRGQGITVVDPKYPLKVAEQLERMQFGWNAYISSFTEPFQVLESVYHNTEQLSEIVTTFGLPLFYLTRQIPPDWAVRYLLKSKYSYCQFSIITSELETYRKLSPGAAPLGNILGFIREVLKPQGIYVSVQVNPILLGIVDEGDICRLIRALGRVGVNHCIFKFVEIVSPAAKAMVAKMHRMFPGERARRFEERFSETIGGLRTIREDARIGALMRFKRECDMQQMTMGLCYEYRYERDGDGRIKDKTGVSLGPEFTTAPQCHGMQIPIHIKRGGQFVPHDVCPPSGCLYCREANGANTPCGVPLLSEARALTPSDYNRKYWRVK
jgi:DNA repair photolyase